MESLTALVDKSLVSAEEREGAVRYRLLETVRQYASERLDTSGEAMTVRDHQLTWCLTMAELASAGSQGPNGTASLARLEEEHDNLRTALAWSLTKGDGEAALRLSVALLRFWQLRGHMSEGRQWLARALEAGTDAPARARAPALHGAGVLAYLQGDYAVSHALHQQALTLCQDLGDGQGIAQARCSLGYLALRRGDYASARSLLEASLAAHADLGDRRGIAGAQDALGVLALRQGDYDAARGHFQASLALHRELMNNEGIASTLEDLATVAGNEGDDEHQAALLGESLTLYREIGNRQGIALVTGDLGLMAWTRGEHEHARALTQESLALYRQVGDRRGVARMLTQQGLVALYERDYQRALTLGREGLALYHDLGEVYHIGRYLPVLAGAALGLGQPGRAARLFGAAAALRARLETPLPPAARAAHDRAVEAARRSLGEQSFAVAWTEGRSLNADDAVNVALTDATG